MNDIKCAYDDFFKNFSQEEFFKFGYSQIIFVEVEKINKNWEELKKKILGNEELFIRGYGRDAIGTDRYITLYKYLFNNINIKKDPSNNYYPTKSIAELTGYKKNTIVNNGEFKKIQNFQISHLFGKTKNPLLFNAAWNFAYIPKYLDPFTGHEAQGEHKNNFEKYLKSETKIKFKNFIIDYNLFYDNHIFPNLENALIEVKKNFRLNKKEFEKFKKHVENELSKIDL